MTLTVQEHRSPNQGPRPEAIAIDMLVLHYTGMESTAAALERMCDPEAAVSAHYLIDEDGAVTRLVEETERAWHAGKSYWRGDTNINDRSIGIELANPGHEFGYRPFPDAQLAALTDLALAVLSRHAIPARNVVGHSDIAPDRKQDPGELFDWRRLADAGVGIWPQPKPAPGEALMGLLQEIGYDPAADRSVAAFQRHFRPDRVDNRPDGETASLAAGLRAAITTKG